MQEALEGLAGINVGDVAVTGAAGQYTITFQNALGVMDVGLLAIASGPNSQLP